MKILADRFLARHCPSPKCDPGRKAWGLTRRASRYRTPGCRPQDASWGLMADYQSTPRHLSEASEHTAAVAFHVGSWQCGAFLRGEIVAVPRQNAIRVEKRGFDTTRIEVSPPIVACSTRVGVSWRLTDRLQDT